MRSKKGQRQIIIDADSEASALHKFQNKEYTFGSTPATNDMWIQVDFNDMKRELKIVEQIQELIGSHYKRLRLAQIQVHCDTGGSISDQGRSAGTDQFDYIEKQLRQLEEKIKGNSSSKE